MENGTPSGIAPEKYVSESAHTPPAAIWRNQLVRVYEKGTNVQVDTGLVTEVSGTAIKVQGEEYAKDAYDFLVMA
jgi:hypothetical protein